MTNGEETLSVRSPSWGHATSVDQAVRQAETLCNIAQESIDRSHKAVNAGEIRLAAQLIQWANTCANAAGSTCNIQVREVREMETEEAEELFSQSLRAQEVLGESEGLQRHETEVIMLLQSVQQGEASGPCLDAIEELHRTVGNRPWDHEDLMATASSLIALAVWNPVGDPLPERNESAAARQIELETIMNSQAELASSPKIRMTPQFAEDLRRMHAPAQGAVVNTTTHNPDTPQETRTHWLLYLSEGTKFAQHLDDPYPKDTSPVLALRHCPDIREAARKAEGLTTGRAVAELNELATALQEAASREVHTTTREEAEGALETAKARGVSRAFQGLMAENLTGGNALLQQRLLGTNSKEYYQKVTREAMEQIIASARKAGADEEAIYWMTQAVGHDPAELGVEPEWLDFMELKALSETLDLEPELAYTITEGMDGTDPRD